MNTWRGALIAQRRHLSDKALLVHISAVYAENRGAYGRPRIWLELTARGIRVGKRQFRIATTDGKHNKPVAPNKLERLFTVAAPNKAWVGDVMYIATEDGLAGAQSRQADWIDLS